MVEESSTFGLSPEKLARLLNIGSDIGETNNVINSEEKKAELLHDWLSATLPLDAVLLESLPIILRRLYRQLQPHLGERFGKVLKNPQTDILVIRKIKDYSKKFVTSARSEAEHDAATAIYFAAIASALLFHDIKITKFSYKTLDESFAKLIDEKWINADIAELFSLARLLCHKKSKMK
jgi:hypothetical protein